MNVGEALLHGIEYTLIGMGTVFAVLIFIALCIKLMGIVIGGVRPKAKAAAAAAEPAQAETAAAAEESADEGLSPEIVAAIMAAIQTKLDAEVGAGGYRLRNIRRAEWRHM